MRSKRLCSLHTQNPRHVYITDKLAAYPQIVFFPHFLFSNLGNVPDCSKPVQFLLCKNTFYEVSPAPRKLYPKSPQLLDSSKNNQVIKRFSYLFLGLLLLDFCGHRRYLGFVPRDLEPSVLEAGSLVSSLRCG